MPKVSFVILTYNSQKFIGKLLTGIFSFYKNDIKGKKIELVIVDNNSVDSTVSEIIKFKEDKIRVIKSNENLGFARGINLGVDNAKGEYIVIINPDTELKGGNIYKTVELFEEDRKIGVIGGRILTRDGGSEKSAGKFFGTFEVFLMSLGLDELFGIRKSPDEFCEVDFVSGGFMIVKRELFKKFLGFDENFFMYVDDMEFCFRVKKSGYTVWFDPNISIIHEGHGSSNRSFAIKNIHKGLIYFHKKHGSAFSYIFVKAILRLKALVLVMLAGILNNRKLQEAYS